LFEIGELGLIVSFLFFILAFAIKDDVWKPIMLFLSVPLMLATGISYIGSGMFSIGFWIGVTMISLSVITSMGGLYYGLSFGRK